MYREVTLLVWGGVREDGVVGSPPKRDRRGQGDRPGWDEQRERC